MHTVSLILFACRLCWVLGRVTLPIEEFLLQQPAFAVEAGEPDSDSLPPISSVPLVMRMLFEEAEAEGKSFSSNRPQGGDFHSLARSVRPNHIEEKGLQRLLLEFPPLETADMWPNAEAWLVFQLKQSHILDNNCTQVLTVYENDKSSLQPVVTVPLNYKTVDPLLVVNITQSLRRAQERQRRRRQRPSYTVIIKDSTSYTRDHDLFSFANYIDCSLARVCEVLELHDQEANPVLLLLSPELAAKNLLKGEVQDVAGGRFRRRALQYSEEPGSWPEPVSEGISAEGEEAQQHCRLQEWTVNIEQLGWDWLVYPERIPLNLCVGSCPVLLDRRFNATSHAVARGLFRLVLGQEAQPDNAPPCCVPVKYRQFTMLIEKSPGIISLETSSDLSAAQCGCR